MKETVMLIDGSSLLFRAFYAIRHLTNKDGLYTNGVYGFLSMFYKMEEMFQPDFICVAFDRSGPTFRHEDYEDYKATREKAPNELSAQFAIIKDVLDDMGICNVDMDNYEADDICGTLAKQAKEAGKQTVLVTGDRDYLQLVDEDIKVVLTKKGISETEVYDCEKIQEEYGIAPAQFVDVKGLMGDKSDNIPGIPGVGEKTALKYIRTYGTMENLYNHLDEIKSVKAREKLEEHRTVAFLSRKLGEIFLDVPLDFTLEDTKKKAPDWEKLYQKFEWLNFNSFKERIPAAYREEEKTAALDELPKLQPVGRDRWKEMAEKAKEFGVLYFKLYYDGFSYVESPPMYAALRIEKENYCVDLSRDAASFFEAFREVLESEEVLKVSYDMKEDIVMAMRCGVEIEAPFLDLMIAEYLLDPSRSNYNLRSVAEKYVERPVISLKELQGKGKSKKTVGELEKEDLFAHMNSMMTVLPELKDKIMPILEEREMEELCFTIEMPLVKVLADMERLGFPVDESILDELGDEFDDHIRRDTEEIHKIAGYEFNINSTKQLGEVLFEKLGLPVIKRTKTGYSSDSEVLEKLRGQNEIIDAIIRYRSTSKLKSTYIDGLKAVIGSDNRIHSRFMQNVAATGRISSTDPNLQNIPIKTEEGRRIRKAFLPSEGRILLDADYSQIELRILAHLSEDETMVQAFKDDLDIHAKTASEVFGVALEEVTSLQRSRAKAVNFGIVYGISDYGLSQNLNITRKEAKEYIENYLDSYPKIRTYMERITEEAKSAGYVETIFHRRRYIPELASKNRNIREFGERIALNTPIQGSAADIIKIAMVRVYNALKSKNMKSKLILQIHDELILDVVPEEEEEVTALLADIMQNAYDLRVPLKVDMNRGKNWYDTK